MTLQPDHEAAIGAAPYVRRRRAGRRGAHPRPRILQLLATGGTGGAQESYTSLLLRLDRTKFEVRALSLSCGSVVRRLRRLGVAVDELEAGDDRGLVVELARYLRRHEIDLLHAHMFRAEVIGVRAGLAAGTPAVVATVHSSRVRSDEDVALIRRLTPHFARLIVPSRSIAAKVRAERDGETALTVIPNGVDLARFARQEACCTLHDEFGIPSDALLVGVVARLEPEKGHRHLIEAVPRVLARNPDAWFLLVGEGSEADNLRRQAAALPRSAARRVVFTGRRDDVAAIVAALDIAVMPSLREAQGIAILEAMAMGKPVVASAVGGIPEVIRHGSEGLLVPPGDPMALAGAISLLGADSALRERMGAAGHATVEERYSVDAMVRATETLYDEELLRAGLPRPQPTPPARPRGRVARRAASRLGRAVSEVPPAG